jgi:threonine/homoserine/homoserine lactone efflux protein
MILQGFAVLKVIYALFGVYLSNWLSKPNMKKLFNRCCALLMATIGIGRVTERRI